MKKDNLSKLLKIEKINSIMIGHTLLVFLLELIIKGYVKDKIKRPRMEYICTINV